MRYLSQMVRKISIGVPFWGAHITCMHPCMFEFLIRGALIMHKLQLLLELADVGLMLSVPVRSRPSFLSRNTSTHICPCIATGEIYFCEKLRER